MEHPVKRPTYEEHIQRLFTEGDAGCMNWAIDLTTYDGVKADAAKISEWIGSGRMPPPDTGRQWSPEKLQTFRNWAEHTGYAEKSFVRIQKSETPRIRQNIHDIEEGSDSYRLLKRAFEGIMARDQNRDDPTSFFNLAGIHWLPGPAPETYCRHHDDGYNPWHRAYLIAFEDGLRSVDGCENVTLPYWDILGDRLPEWVYKPPFFKYPLPYELTSLNGAETYSVGYESQRSSAQQIVEKVEERTDSIADKIAEALAAETWRGFNGWSDWPNAHEGIIRAHDNGHDVCGLTIGNQDIAAFDPLFWFFHCNWDRLWWQWQQKRNTTSLLSFRAVVTGDTHWLDEAPDTLLLPFDVNAREMINLRDWNVDYESPPDRLPEVDELLVASRGNTHAVRSFHVPRTDRYSVRVKDINRLDIPGSFDVVLYSGERVLARTHIFQPSSPRECENCRKQGVFSTDFIVNRTDLDTNEEFHIAIEVKNSSGEMVEFPLADAGDPTVNIRLLLSTT